MSTLKNKLNLIWLDLEMTGLDPEKEKIIEIATIVTDSQLNILAEGPVFAITQSSALLESMDTWNTNQHNASGLVDRVKNSSITEEIAELKTLDFLSKYLDAGISPMCGNSICQDRRFLYKYMPKLSQFFHYRNLDVSTIKELALRWHPNILPGFKKQNTHLALNDIKESIEELRYYKEHFFTIK